MEFGLSVQQVWGRAPGAGDGNNTGGGGNTGGGLAPLSGILDAANVVIIGASIFEGAFEDGGTINPIIAGYAAGAGFTGTLSSYAQAGDKVLDGIAKHATAKADLATDEGNNLYIVHVGGNDVSTNRPHPGGAATFQAEYDTLMANITATDTVIPLPLTKRLYSGAPTVVQGDAASEANGSKPYNDATILPAIAAHAPDWIAAGTPYVDTYAFIDRHPEVLSADGVHGAGTAIARYVLAKIAGRALGIAEGTSRTGQGIVYNMRAGNPDLASIGPVNRIYSYANGTPGNPLFYGGVTDDGGFDPHIRVSTGIFTNGSTGMGSSAFARLPDTRFHDTGLVGSGIYVLPGVDFTLTFDALTPGDAVTVTCCGLRNTTKSNRQGDLTLTGGQTLTLNPATTAASNQVTFAPITVPADGQITLTLTVAPGSLYAYLHGVILDF